MPTDPDPQPIPEQAAAKVAEKQIEKIQKDKELIKNEGKEFIKAENKEQKDFKDGKEQKDHKPETKEHKEQKDNKEQKDSKEQKDHKPETKEHKEHKDNKDNKDHKHEIKEHKIEAKEKEIHIEGLPSPAQPLGDVATAAAKLMETSPVKSQIAEIKHYKSEIVEKTWIKEFKEWKDHHEYVVGPVDIPGPGPVEERLAMLEQAVAEMSHFIQASQRPDLSGGALRGEPEAGQAESPAEGEEQ